MPSPNDWVQFTKRTNDPKLSWLEATLEAAGIRSRRHGESFHAPILQVQEKDFESAWSILEPLDDVPDHHFANAVPSESRSNIVSIEYATRVVTREGFEFRLVYSPQYGIGLQARPVMLGDDWVDVSLMQDADEVSDVITDLLGIALDTE